MGIGEAELAVEVPCGHVAGDDLEISPGSSHFAAFRKDALYDRGGNASLPEILADMDRIDADVVPVEDAEAGRTAGAVRQAEGDRDLIHGDGGVHVRDDGSGGTGRLMSAVML